MNTSSDFVSVKAYGKIVLFGAYSVLEPGNIGMVLQVNHGSTACVRVAFEKDLEIDLPNFDIFTSGHFVDDKLRLLKDRAELVFVKNSIEYVYAYLKIVKIPWKKIKVTCKTDNELINEKVKTGFGSSATAVVSVVSAILKFHGIDDKFLAYKISRYSHYKSQGKLGSGIDCAAAVFGGGFFINSEKKLNSFRDYVFSDILCPIEQFDMPVGLLPVFIFTGKSASTKQYIQKLLKFKNNFPKKYYDHMTQYNEVNKRLRKAFLLGTISEIEKLLQESWAFRDLLCKSADFDVVPNKIRFLINKFLENGAWVAGLHGAGGGDSIVAFCLNEKEKKRLIDFAEENDLLVLKNLTILNSIFEFKIGSEHSKAQQQL